MTANTFSVQSMFNKIRVHVGTDHVGCAVTRRSTAVLCTVLDTVRNTAAAIS